MSRSTTAIGSRPSCSTSSPPATPRSDIEAKLKEAILAFKEIFAPTEGRAGSAAALGAPTPPDQVKPDVGWDRMSSVDEDEDEDKDKEN